MKKILLILTLCLGTQVAYAQEPLQQLKKFLKNSKTLTASFKQVLFDKDHKIKQTSTGLFYLSRPGKFRWSYKTPFVQEIVSNSGKVWFYDKDLEQVTIKKMDASMG
ncbi:MAG: outer-membrane lipoprotein carrier protein LolA, partial [Methylococcales bacterium]|nr:outer-membrane lipoprotein carrier protein LolA [Methylococcales bacterium]